MTKNRGTLLGPKTLIERKYPLGNGTEGTDLYITRQGFETVFASDVPKRLADRMWAEQRPFSQEAFVSPSGKPAWKTIPSWDLVTTQDHAIPPATQMFMAHRAHATIEKVKSSHVPMISHPAATTKLILEAANSVDYHPVPRVVEQRAVPADHTVSKVFLGRAGDFRVGGTRWRSPTRVRIPRRIHSMAG